MGLGKIFHPDRNRLVELGYRSVAHVPVVFDGDGKYCRDINRYLRERAHLDWHPAGGGDYPSDRTLNCIAERLKNFNDWCAIRGQEPRALSYKEVLRYQREQLDGTWARRGRLRASTANQRADDATNFLTWAAQRGLRGPFPVKRFFSRKKHNGNFSIATARAGRAKENEISKSSAAFVLPTREAITLWLNSIQAMRGYAKYLACRLILETGMRREEVEKLDVDRWPSSDDIAAAVSHPRQTVPMEITKTKGGRPRTVMIPTGFADRVRIWIDGRRLNYALRYHKLTRHRTARLFLSDHESAHGRPISAQTIYRCFTEIPGSPLGWCPHKGRHCFACFFILDALAAEAGPKGIASHAASWVMNRGEYWIDFLRRQFGHVSPETTRIYLRWVATACGIAEIASGWHQFLEDSSECPL